MNKMMRAMAPEYAALGAGWQPQRVLTSAWV